MASTFGDAIDGVSARLAALEDGVDELSGLDPEQAEARATAMLAELRAVLADLGQVSVALVSSVVAERRGESPS